MGCVEDVLIFVLMALFSEYAIGAKYARTPATYTLMDRERTSSGAVRENWSWNIVLRTIF